ncbi:MAG: GNAT family N-acetyltransferase, partial [Thermoleophilia bacterium]|nr:GNAT family N-acetyltransferase [Thermoleophilia bacterium]
MRDLSQVAQPPGLTDGRVRLRRVDEKDRDAVVKALNDPVAARFLTRPPFPYLDEHFDEWLELAASGRGLHEAQAAHWSIADADDDSYLGGASLEVAVWRDAGEIGYQVAPWARGRGVATAAARLIRDWAFDELELARLEIAADVDNIASQRVAQAAGFSYEGVARGYLEGRVVVEAGCGVSDRAGTSGPHDAGGPGDVDGTGDAGGTGDGGGPGGGSDARVLRREPRDHVLFGMVRADPRAPAAPVPWPCLDDGGLVVRAFEPDDAAAVADACGDPEIARWIYRLPAPYTLADAERFVAGARRTLVSGEQIRLAVADAATGELLGSVSLEPSWQLDLAEVGYWVKREARRRGVATA